MTGAMPADLAARAGALALKAEAEAAGVSVPRLIGRRLRAALERAPKREADSLPGRTWREIDPSVKAGLCALALGGDFIATARLPWESLTAEQRGILASTARLFGGELRNAAALW